MLEHCRKLIFAAALVVVLASLVVGQRPQDNAESGGNERSRFGIADAYRDTADRIIKEGLRENDSYLKLQELCDDIGHRLSGTPELDEAIEWAKQTLGDDGHENVRGERVMVPKWVRGNEYCQLIAPRELKLEMLGLGGSVGTPAEGIEAEVIVVRDKDELDSLADEQIEGKIVVFNYPMPPYSPTRGSGYGDAVQYRGNGAIWAAERGAVAALVRSVTAYSLNSPHTGTMRLYPADSRKIPAAAITVEAATLLARWQKRGIRSRVKLVMEARDEGMVPSANVIAEIVGSEKPEEIVVIGGHIDSWDVGAGAQDDGCGCVVAMEALNLLRRLDLKPRRTIRVVLWTNEENGAFGARSYVERHQNEVHVAGIESDSGGFAPQGLSVEMQDEKQQELAAAQLQDIMSLLKPVRASVVETGFSGVDVGPLKQIGCACMGLRVDGSRYFNTHHTWADTVDKVDPDELSACTVTMAVAAYVLADMPQRIGIETGK